MANKKLLQEAIEAFANGDKAVADKKMRKFFVETAQEINRKLEEEMEEELDEAEELDESDDAELVEEDINTAPDQDLNQDVQYSLGEADHSDEDEVEDADVAVDGVDGVDGAEDSLDVDVDADVEGDVPEDKWSSIRDAFAGLAKAFDEIAADESDVVDVEGEDFGDESEDVDLDIDAEPADEFGGVSFGDEKFGEGYKMKNVAKPSNDAAKSRSPVASNAKSPVPGVNPVKIKDGSVTVVDDSFDGKDSLSPKVDDMNNVMDSGKSMMKDVSVKKTTADKSKSVLPSKKA